MYVCMYSYGERKGGRKEEGNERDQGGKIGATIYVLFSHPFF